MSAAYYTVLSEEGGNGDYRAAGCTAGPWSAVHQHGGPPSALLVRAAERAVSAATGRDDLHALRFSGEFVGPVPVGDCEVHAHVVRAARTAAFVQTALRASGRDCLQARVSLVARADTAAVAMPRDRRRVQPPARFADLGADFPYGHSIEWRSLGVSMRVPGPGATWARPRIPLVEDEVLSGLQRTVLVCDSASGISSELDWDHWTFPNVDLDVHLSRPVAGEWLLVDAATTIGPDGAALARSVVSDVDGEVGVTAQTLVVRPQR